MRHILFLLFGLIFLTGCEETEVPVSVPLTLKEQLVEVMKIHLPIMVFQWFRVESILRRGRNFQLNRNLH